MGARMAAHKNLNFPDLNLINIQALVESPDKRALSKSKITTLLINTSYSLHKMKIVVAVKLTMQKRASATAF